MDTKRSWPWLLLALLWLVPFFVDCQPAPQQETPPQERPTQDQFALDRPLPDQAAPPERRPPPDIRPRQEQHPPDTPREQSPEPPRDVPGPPEETPETPQSPAPALGLTYHRRDGNRLVSGKGALLTTQPLDISLSGEPLWLVALPTPGGSVWTAVLTDGRVESFAITQRKFRKLQPQVSRLPAKMPPVLHMGTQGPALVPPPRGASTLSHPLPLAAGRLVFIEEKGDLVLWANGREAGRLSLKALPDARILVDEQERLLLLTDPTTRYGHGVLGDAIEAASITLVATKPKLQVLQKIVIPGQRVVEGIAPIWADLNGDGKRSIIVTLSDNQQGAQLVAYDEKGQVRATSPAIGTGNRWRNQVAVAPFGPGGVLELVDVFTPHIGGPTEFFQLQGKALRRVAQLSGYTAHVYGARNLDLGLAGDFNGDGRPALVLPSQDLTNLGIISRSGQSAKTLKTLSVGGRLSTNIAAVDGTQTGNILVGVGTSGRLRIWGAK